MWDTCLKSDHVGDFSALVRLCILFEELKYQWVVITQNPVRMWDSSAHVGHLSEK